jgi:hypothetical protein
MEPEFHHDCHDDERCLKSPARLKRKQNDQFAIGFNPEWRAMTRNVFPPLATGG